VFRPSCDRISQPSAFLTFPAIRRFRFLSSAAGTTCVAAVLYSAFAVYLTWPLLPDLSSRIFAVEPGDPMGSISILRELVDGRLNPYLPAKLEDFNAPTGLSIDWSLNIAAFPSTAVLYALALVFGAVAAWGLFALLGFVASALSMFLLLRKYTGETGVALVFGWAYGFYPFVVLTAHSVHFVHGWVFVLLGWRMLVLAEKPTARNGLFAGAAAVLTFAWTPYFILFGGVCYATFVAADLVAALLRGTLRAHLRAHAFSGVIILPFLAGIGALWILAQPASAPDDAGRDAITRFAARPVEYVLPPAEHPLFGGRTGPFIARSVAPFASVYPLYLGTVTLALTICATIVGLRRRSRVVLTFAAVALVGLAFSMPPQVRLVGRLISFPSYYTSELVGTWRIYARFVVIVMFAVCVLAAIGAAVLLEHRQRGLRVVLLALLAVAVPLDLWVTPPVRTTKIVVPPIYDVLRKQPDGVVAEYPMRPADLSGDYSFLLYQQAHGKPIVNGFPRRSQAEARALHLSRLDELSTATGLARLGVKYVLLRHEVEPGAMTAGKPSQDFRPIADSSFATILRVVPPSDRVTTFPLTGFWLPEGNPPTIFRWMVEDTAKLEVRGPCTPCDGTLEFRSASFARARQLVVRDEDGNVVARERVEPDRPKWVRAPLQFSHRTVLTLHVTPPPDRISDYIPGGDPRSVAVSVIQPTRFVARNGAAGSR
jgi:hypothetical protein